MKAQITLENPFQSKELIEAARTVVEDVCKLKIGEKVLIVTNELTDVLEISRALYRAVKKAGGIPTLIVQEEKTILDYAEPAVIGALKTEPSLFFSISSKKLGKDEETILFPRKGEDGRIYDHIFNYLLEGKKCMRALWTPGVSLEMFERTVCIDYEKLRKRSELIIEKYKNAQWIHVTNPAGTDIKIPVKGRKAFCDDGDFSQMGSGGNIPSGEVYISPIVGGKTGIKGDIANGCQGTIVFDGSMTVNEGDILIEDPIVVKVEDGFVTTVEAKSQTPVNGDNENLEAWKLLRSILEAERTAALMEMQGKIAKDTGKIYAQNARNIGEFGIGLNTQASITGNMLEDEKAFETCHFAIGENYDGDANSLIHLDGVLRKPTIVIHYKNGSEYMLENDGILSAEFSEI